MFEPFADVPAYPLVFPLFWGAAAVFALAMARHLRVFAVARPSAPFANLPARVVGLVEYAFIQTKMFKDPRAGLMHAGIFWGFVLLTIGTADVVTGGVIQTVLAAPLDGAIWAAISAMQNVVALVVIASIGWAFVRRLVIKPARLTLNRDALLILSMIGGLVAAELLAQCFQAARYGDVPGAIVANAVAVPLRSLAPGPLEIGFGLLWWLHIGLVAAFLCYLPSSKHLHIATAFPNVFLRKLAPRGELPKMDLEDETATFGLKTLQDLGWKDLLDGFTCTECGRCQQACPAWNTGKPLNPKHFIMGIRELSVEAEHGIDLIPNSPIVRETYGLDDTRPAAAALARPIVDEAIPFDAVWDCVTCGACVEACPVLIEHVDKIVGLRRNLVLEESRFPAELTTAFRAMENQGNPWGQPAGERTAWTRGLEFDVPVVADLAAAGRLDDLEVLYWVGCAAAFDPRNQKVARAVATCLHAAGVEFAILGQEESCTGDPARRMGNDYVYQILAAGNVDTLNRYGMGERTIVTACPHCFNTIGNEYGQLGGDFEIVHHSVYLRRLVREGRLKLAPDKSAEA
ncbi:MAG TPA: (Fe-S)-binding protein, partial [Candidatus Limnocylindrales bacterium]